MRLNSLNIYDAILAGLYILLAFGMYGGGAQPIRLTIVGLAPFMVFDVVRRPHASLAYYKYEVFFLIFWWLISAAFLYKAVDLTESVKHIMFLLIHITGFLEVIWIANKAKNPQRSICYGWIIMLLVTIPVAVWEFTGGQHLPTTITEHMSIIYNNVRIDRPYAAVTFGNLNSYNTAICWALPYLFITLLFPQKKYDTLVTLLTFFPLFLIVILNSSRGAIICIAALIIIYISCYLKIGRHKSTMLGLVFLAVFVLAYYLYEMFYFIIGRFTDQGMNDDGRTENIVKGVEAFFDSWCLGIGIGNYEPIMDRIYQVAIPAPHNLFLEILVVWGIFVTAGFIFMLWRIFKKSRQGSLFNHYFIRFGFVCLLLGGMVDSGYWMKATTWFFFVGLYILSDSRYNRKEEIRKPPSTTALA